MTQEYLLIGPRPRWPDETDAGVLLVTRGDMLLRCCFTWLLLLAPLASRALAANEVDTGKPNAVSEPRNPLTTPETTCPQRPEAGIGNGSTVIVALASDTLWRPRGSEVRFIVNNAGQTAAIQQVRVCFGWSSAAAQVESGAFHALQASPIVRSVASSDGVPTYGAVMPALVDTAQPWWNRLQGPNKLLYSALFTVPLADMVVEVTPAGAGGSTVVVLPIGVTSVSYASVLVLLFAVLFCVGTSVLTRTRGIPGRNFLLRLISTRDGYASLSQFQIMLWTVVIGLCAVYVMTLSGSLIPITTGTLVLLGIAAGAALLARVPTGATTPVPDLPVAAEPDQPRPPVRAATEVPSRLLRLPRWSDLVTVDDGRDEIDVTRVQMLIFTLIAAVFVTLKVIVSYEIPTISENFQLLMGISNGVYVGGRHLPGQGRKG
jgi:hypothetical protein